MKCSNCKSLNVSAIVKKKQINIDVIVAYYIIHCNECDHFIIKEQNSGSSYTESNIIKNLWLHFHEDDLLNEWININKILPNHGPCSTNIVIANKLNKKYKKSHPHFGF